MRALYLSYDGLTDPLGQSQILPYLIRLVKAGHEIDIVSFEKKNRFTQLGKEVKAVCAANGLGYFPEKYTKSPPVLSTLLDIQTMRKAALRLHRAKNYDLLHCRSDIPAMIGEEFSRKYNIPFLFDMRGFYADERVDGHIWPQNKWIYRKVYEYFKKREAGFYSSAGHLISLTRAAEKIILEWTPGLKADDISVIPCCVDHHHFSQANVDKNRAEQFRNELQTDGCWPVLSYVGSTGTWYLPGEMLLFFKLVLKSYPDACFVFITRDEPEGLLKLADSKGISRKNIRVIAAERNDLPALLSLIDLSVFFIKPAFSKKASSPTKQAELMAMGIPVICNDGVGDTTEIVSEYHSGYVIPELTAEAMEKAVMTIPGLMQLEKQKLTNGACAYFSLEKGVEKLDQIYRKIGERKNPTHR